MNKKIILKEVPKDWGWEKGWNKPLTDAFSKNLAIDRDRLYFLINSGYTKKDMAMFFNSTVKEIEGAMEKYDL